MSDERAGYELVRSAKVDSIEFPEPRPKYTHLMKVPGHRLVFDSPRFLAHPPDNRNFPYRSVPLWNKNWLDGTDDWHYAWNDHQVYNKFVDAVNERLDIYTLLTYNPTYPAPNLPLPDPSTYRLIHAVEGDYLAGIAVGLAGGLGGGSTVVGWAYLMSFVALFNDTSFLFQTPPDELMRWNVAFVRAYDTATGVSGFYNTSTAFKLHTAGPPDHSGDFAQTSNYFVPNYYPYEIQSLTDAPGTVGAHARLIGASNIRANGTNTGHIFRSDGLAWKIDDKGSGGLPDVLMVNNGAAYNPDDRRRGGDYYEANTLQRLRDKLNMMVGYYFFPGSPWNTTTVQAQITATQRVSSGSGNTIAAANADCLAHYGTFTDSITDVIGSQWSYTTPSILNPGMTYDVAAGRSDGVIVLESCPTFGGTYAFEAFVSGFPGASSAGNYFDAHGDPFIDQNTSGLYDTQSDVRFFARSGTISAAQTNWTSATIGDRTAYPDGSSHFPLPSSAGVTALSFTAGSGVPSGTLFFVFRYDVPGGFKYTKDTTT